MKVAMGNTSVPGQSRKTDEFLELKHWGSKEETLFKITVVVMGWRRQERENKLWEYNLLSSLEE